MRYAAAVVLVVACASRVQAQAVGQTLVQGRVLGGDSTALVAAQIELTDSSGGVVLHAASDARGWFRIPFGDRIRPGLFYITVHYLGYADVGPAPIRVGKSEEVVLAIRMDPTPIALQPVNVTARRRYRPGPSEEFRDRAYWVKRSGFGHVLEYEQLQQLIGASLVQAAARLPGVTRSYVNSAVAGMPVEVVRMRGGCLPLVYLDRMPLSFVDWSSIDVASLEGIEVYRNAAEVPPQYANPMAGDCGVILAWSNRRLEGARPLTWKRLAVTFGLAAIIFVVTR